MVCLRLLKGLLLNLKNSLLCILGTNENETIRTGNFGSRSIFAVRIKMSTVHFTRFCIIISQLAIPYFNIVNICYHFLITKYI